MRFLLGWRFFCSKNWQENGRILKFFSLTRNVANNLTCIWGKILWTAQNAGNISVELVITPLWRCHGIVIAVSSLCQGGRMAFSRHCDYIAIVLRLRCNHSTIKTQSHRPDVVIAPPSHMKRRGHLIEMAKTSIRNMGNIGTIATIEFIENVLKKSHFGCLRASFCFINTKKVAPRCGRKSMKGHQTHHGIFYFESCVCQKKRNFFLVWDRSNFMVSHSFLLSIYILCTCT